MDTYYTNMKENYEKGGGWAGLYYGVFEKAIRDNNFKVVAEVGIGWGFHAKTILDNTDVEKLFLVDPMEFYPNDGFATEVLSHGGFDMLVKNIKINLSEHESRYTWFRQPSISISHSKIADGSLDAVFLDGDHSYESVCQDLPFWFSKLRTGGWLLGDDYASCHPGCTRAVDEFASKHNLKLDFLFKPGTKYTIYKFVKE